jgi:hypothetical protein
MDYWTYHKTNDYSNKHYIFPMHNQFNPHKKVILHSNELRAIALSDVIEIGSLRRWVKGLLLPIHSVSSWDK